MSDTIVVGPLVQRLLAKPQEEQLPLLIEYLGSHSEAKVVLATHVLTGAGPPIVSTLIHQAFARNRRPTHAVRLLEIVARIGGPVSFDDWMLLSAARALPKKLVGDKCSELLLRLGHAGSRPESRRRLEAPSLVG